MMLNPYEKKNLYGDDYTIFGYQERTDEEIECAVCGYDFVPDDDETICADCEEKIKNDSNAQIEFLMDGRDKDSYLYYFLLANKDIVTEYFKEDRCLMDEYLNWSLK